MNYAAMTDEELRQEVAKRKGFINIRHYHDKWTGEHDTEEWGVTRDRIPEYSLEISGAWELVEEMDRVEGITIENGWLVLVDNFSRTIKAIAPTAPRAICIAWLQWKDQMNE